MLSVRNSASRDVMSLEGVWRFQLDPDDIGQSRGWFAAPLSAPRPMPVPASYNDVTADLEVHDHVGPAWYERDAVAPHNLGRDRLILRFGSVTHDARVWVDAVQVAEHVGGYLPFEADITEQVTPGKTFRITVRVDNRLSWQSIPVGFLEADSQGHPVQGYFHDFFNYAGIHRSVSLYTRPPVAVTDVTIVSAYTNGPEGTTGRVTYTVEAEDAKHVHVIIKDAEGVPVARADGSTGEAIIPDAHLWWPGAGYLYTLEVHAVGEAGEDVYPQRFGVRTVEVRDSQFLINGEPFYFRGYGRHEDNLIRGKGHDPVLMVHDFELMEWQGANSFRTSHYPYAEEVMDYADERGFVVIDETAAVGLNTAIIGGFFGGGPIPLFSEEHVNARTQAVHAAHIRELIARDKNHPCVVLWSLANEPESHTEEALDYFEPLAAAAQEADPTRPVGYVNVMVSTPDRERVVDLFDVVMLNRYYGWYVNNGDLAGAESALRAEIEAWIERAPGKPILFTEYGAYTLVGMRDLLRRPWSEEFQVDLLGMYHRVFDSYREIVGEQMWNFADFQTGTGTTRVGGNRKGMFTRSREPKQNAFAVRERWLEMRRELGS